MLISSHCLLCFGGIWRTLAATVITVKAAGFREGGLFQALLAATPKLRGKTCGFEHRHSAVEKGFWWMVLGWKWEPDGAWEETCVLILPGKTGLLHQGLHRSPNTTIRRFMRLLRGGWAVQECGDVFACLWRPHFMQTGSPNGLGSTGDLCAYRPQISADVLWLRCPWVKRCDTAQYFSTVVYSALFPAEGGTGGVPLDSHEIAQFLGFYIA